MSLPENYIYELLPSGIVDLDTRGIIDAICGGFQDRVEDLRSNASQFSTFFDPDTAPPMSGDNVIFVTIAKSQGNTFVRSLDIEDDAPADDDPELLTWCADKLDLEIDDVVSAQRGRDPLRSVDANILQYLALTVGAILYKTDAADSVEDQRKLLKAYFPRLKVKGTAQSYSILGRLLGFDDVIMDPLWGRVSPRIPNDVGNAANAQDFAFTPERIPTSEITDFYDPSRLADGPFYEWTSADLNTSSTSGAYYLSINGLNPFFVIKLLDVNSAVSHIPVGRYKLSGGGPHVKASNTISGTNMMFEAIAEGDSFNWMAVIVSYGASGSDTSTRSLYINERLSSLQYRTSYFDVSLLKDASSIETVPVERDDVTKEYPADAIATDIQLDTRSLVTLGVQTSAYLEELRVATRFPRNISVGVQFRDKIEFASYISSEILFSTNGTQNGTATTFPLAPYDVMIGYEQYRGDIITLSGSSLQGTLKRKPERRPPNPGMVEIHPFVAKKNVTSITRSGGTATVTCPSHGFSTNDNVVIDGADQAPYNIAEAITVIDANTFTYPVIDLPATPATGTITVTKFGPEITTDDGLGQITPSGIVTGGTVDYDSRQIKIVLSDTTSSVVVVYKALTFASAEVDGSDPKVINIQADKLVGSFDKSTGDYTFESTLDNIINVVAVWVPTSTEIIRPEPADLSKLDGLTLEQARPEDSMDQTSTGVGLSFVQFQDDIVWERPLLASGDLISLDSYHPTSADQKLIKVDPELTVLDHRGVEWDVIGYDSPNLTTAPRLKFKVRDASKNPGTLALARSGPDIYHVGLVQGVLIADPLAFFAPSHYDGLVGWMMFNNHPDDDLTVNDLSEVSTSSNVNGTKQADRIWDSARGWTQKVRNGASFTFSGERGTSTNATLSFWIKPGATASAYDSTIIQYGSLSVDLAGQTSTLNVYRKSYDGARILVKSVTLTGNFDFISIVIDGSSTTVSVNLTDYSGLEEDYEELTGSDDLTVLSSDRDYQVHDMRLWSVSKTADDLAHIHGHTATPTVVATSLPKLLTYKGHKVAMTVLSSNLVFPTLAQSISFKTISSITWLSHVATVTTSGNHGFSVGDRVTISGATPTQYNGNFIIESSASSTTFTFLLTSDPGSSASEGYASVFESEQQELKALAIRYKDDGSYVGDTRQREIGLGGGQDFSSSAWSLGTQFYVVSSSGKAVISTSESALPGSNQLWRSNNVGTGPTPLEASNPVLDRIYLKSTAGAVYEVTLDKLTQSGNVEFVTSLVIRDDDTESPSRPTSDIDSGGHLLEVDDGTGDVIVGSSVPNGVIPPTFMYLQAPVVQDIGVGLWQNQTSFGLAQSPNVAAIEDPGKIIFLGTETIDPGHYRIEIDLGNIGDIGKSFPGYSLEIAVGSVILPVTAMEGAQGTDPRETVKIEFELDSTLTPDWLVEIDWLNNSDIPEQGIFRNLAVFGVKIRKLAPEVYHIDGLTLTQVTLTDSTTPGGWYAQLDNKGNVKTWTHESDVSTVPVDKADSTIKLSRPVNDVLTSSTDERREDLILTSGSFTLPDPSTPAAPTLGALSSTISNPVTVTWLTAGAVTPTTAVVNAKLSGDADHAVAVASLSSSLSDVIEADEAIANSSGSDVVSFQFSGLKPDTTYYYAVGEKEKIDLSVIGQLKTTKQDTAYSFSFAASSGAISSSNHVVFDTIRLLEPQMFLHLGNMHHTSNSTTASYKSAWDTVFSQSKQAQLYHSTCLAYIWGSVDVGSNTTNARSIYQSYFPHYTLSLGDGDNSLSYAFVVGRVYFIVTDLYTPEKSSAGATDNSSKTMLGAAQKAWFKQRLLDAKTAGYKLIVWVNNLPWYGTSGNGWRVYTTERAEIANFVKDNSIKGLVILSAEAETLAADDGTNTDFATGGGAGIPVIQVGALDTSDNPGTTYGGTYSAGSVPNNGVRGQFGYFTITDDGGDVVKLDVVGYDENSNSLLTFSTDSSKSPKV